MRDVAGTKHCKSLLRQRTKDVRKHLLIAQNAKVELRTCSKFYKVNRLILQITIEILAYRRKETEFQDSQNH